MVGGWNGSIGLFGWCGILLVWYISHGRHALKACLTTHAVAVLRPANPAAGANPATRVDVKFWYIILWHCSIGILLVVGWYLLLFTVLGNVDIGDVGNPVKVCHWKRTRQ